MISFFHRVADRVRQAALPLRCARFLRTPLRRLAPGLPAPAPLPARDQIDLVTVAFNNDRVIAQQIRLVQKNFPEPHHHLIADNSSAAAACGRIAAVCRSEGVSYLRMPSNPYAGRDGSSSHGLALNWLWRHWIGPRRADAFGFLDHDVFPIRPTAVRPLLRTQPVWGHKQSRGARWYLWPGLCFFSRPAVEGRALDFMPLPGLDTGGGNWPVLYAGLAVERLAFPPRELLPLREGSCVQADSYEVLGDWLHTFNASGWMKVPPKQHLIDELLARY